MTYSILIGTRALQNSLWLLVGIALLLALLRPRFAASHFRKIEAFASRIARCPWRPVLFAGLFPLIARVVLLPVLPFPGPHIHDEYSYLLQADTFAHGRLANPTPPSPEHFETEYELMRPTYASQYQPGQGLFLAAGKVVAGHPWWGVWFSAGLMCSALCWALAGFVPARWALFGAFLAALQFGIYGFWMNSYFGGAVAAIGGALVFGSLTRHRYPALCALGLLILFATRPVEAVLWCIAAIVMTKWSVRGAMAFALVFAIGVIGLCYYNNAVTGHPLDPPYLAYRRQYGVPQSYWWQPAITISHFANNQLAANYRDQLDHWRQRYSAAALWNSTWRRARDFWRFFIGPFATPALLFAGLLFRRQKLRPWLWISALFILDHATYHAWYPQQSAPETVLIVLLLVECWRSLRAWQRPRGYGIALTRSLTAAFIAAILLLSVGHIFLHRLPRPIHDIWASLVPESDPREAVIERLNGLPGKHLVFIYYRSSQLRYDEWVFNEADIPNSRIVFARAISPESDRILAAALPGRDLWNVDADTKILAPATAGSPRRRD
ncbi:MAG: hypothetical protein ABJC09_15895 [Terriglobia bacterium]